MRLDLSPLLDHPLGDRLHDKVMAHIALRVIRATNKDSAAENLTEATFCRQLKVSRTVVREAVRVLAAKGLVEVRQKAGIRGRPRRYWHHSDPDVLRWIRKAGLNLRLILDLCEIRQILEPAAAELAVRPATSEQIAAIQAAYKRMASSGKRNRKYIDGDVEFHYAVLTAIGNDLLSHVARTTIREALRYSIAFSVKAPASAIKPNLELHCAIAEAIARRDGKAARTLTERLVERSRQDLTVTFCASRGQRQEKTSTEGDPNA